MKQPPTQPPLSSVALLLAAFLGISFSSAAMASFRIDFEGEQTIRRVSANEGGGWSWYAGDGEARADMLSRNGYGTLLVDAREDRLNIWWAVCRRRIDEGIDYQKLAQADHELRVEVRVRVSHAPRRINLQLFGSQNQPRQHLREFDIPNAGKWSRISMTTDGFNLKPGDSAFFQLAMMDWGQELHATDIDYIEIEVVKASDPGPSYGLPLLYHPPLPEPKQLPHVETVARDAIIDPHFPDLPLHDWGNPAFPDNQTRLLPVTPSQTVLLHWDLKAYRGRSVQGVSSLELTTHSLTRLLGKFEEIGRIRVVEILENAPDWNEDTVTFRAFAGSKLTTVTNAQTVIDVEINPEPGALNRIALSQPVMQRLIDGTSKGLALRSLGPINATFIARENAPRNQAPTLRFALADD